MKTLRQLERVGALAILTALMACTTTATVPVGSPETTRGAVTESRPNATRGAAKGQDENIRAGAGQNVVGAAITAQVPAHKQAGGAATRGTATCLVRFDNRTYLYIETYLDGYSAGMLGPWGDVYAYAIAGPTRVYGRAEFPDGRVLTWGPYMFDCPAGGSYHWTLYP